MSDDVYITLDSSVYLVIDNPASNALTTTGAGGNIISESETSIVRWVIEDSLGSYTIPFTTLPVSRGGNSTKMPLTVNITAVGSSLGTGGEGFNFSTFETTNDDNTPYPAWGPVLSMNDQNGDDISLVAIDRFWVIDRSDYFQSPSLEITFGYDDSPNELGGSNAVTESTLQGYSYDEQNDIWGEITIPLLGLVQQVSGTADTVNNNVSGVQADGSAIVSYKLWTLAGEYIPPGACITVAYKMFTPNGDLKNDTWIIDCIDETPNNTVTIVNRWGDEVASFAGYDNSSVVWDGTNKGGELLNPGTYFYVINIEDTGDKHTGWVQIVY